MRPDAIDTLVALRRVLADVVRPEVKDDYVVKQIDHMLLALDDLAAGIPTLFAWRLESLDLLRSILSDVQSRAGLDAEGVQVRIAEALAIADAPMPAYPTLDELERRLRPMRVSLSEAIPILSRRAKDLRCGSEVLDRIRDYLRQNAQRS